MIRLHPKPLTPDAFAAFGDVIAANQRPPVGANAARFERYLDLAKIDVDGGCDSTQLSLMVCREASSLPYTLPLLERHPKGSQAFIPTSPFAFFVVVAPADPAPNLNAVQAFVTDGAQGINMRRGVWHNPMIGLEAGQTFLVVDCGQTDNCDEVALGETVVLERPQ